MEDITQQISHFAKVSLHGTLSGIIKKRLNNQQSRVRKDYFGVTDICNPLQTYFRIKYPGIYKDSVETKKRFSLGKKQHNIIQKKLETMKGFVDREIILDGRLLGIPLKGRADAKIDASIWEIKSKEVLPKDINELLKNYPQDIEQLCFYSLIDPEAPKENILINTTYSNSEDGKAYKITINDLGKIKNIAMARIEKLNKWLDEDNLPVFPFRCRYCNGDCNIKNSDLCSFFENESLTCEVKDFISIEEVPEIEEDLKKISVFKSEIMPVFLFNLITPRKLILQEFCDLEEEPFDNSYKTEHKQLIQDVLYEEGKVINNEELKKLKESQKIKEIYQGRNSFIKLNLNGEEKIFPLLIHINPKTDPGLLQKVSDYKRGELGLHCLNNGVNQGYLIAYFPEQNHEVRVFEISYNFEKGILEEIKKIAEIIKSKDKERLSELPKCPDFMCKDCAYRGVCLE